jgi:hypothetical protein
MMADLWRQGLDFPADLDAVAVREPHVEDGHVGDELADGPQSLLGRSGLAHDIHVVLGFEERAQPGAHQLVIVEEEDPNRHFPNIATPPAAFGAPGGVATRPQRCTPRARLVPSILTSRAALRQD